MLVLHVQPHKPHKHTAHIWAASHALGGPVTTESYLHPPSLALGAARSQDPIWGRPSWPCGRQRLRAEEVWVPYHSCNRKQASGHVGSWVRAFRLDPDGNSQQQNKWLIISLTSLRWNRPQKKKKKRELLLLSVASVFPRDGVSCFTVKHNHIANHISPTCLSHVIVPVLPFIIQCRYFCHSLKQQFRTLVFFPKWGALNMHLFLFWISHHINGMFI